MSTNDIYAQLLPEVKPKGKGAAGGGEDMTGASQYVRADSIRRAKPVAYWSGALRADANGKARFNFDIPDFQGGVLPSGIVSFAAGQTSQVITVNVAGNTVVEPNEAFTVTLGNPSVGAIIGT